MKSGIDEYQLPTLHRIQSYPYTIVENYMMQLGLFQTLNREYIVSGGDSGFARVSTDIHIILWIPCTILRRAA